MPYEALNGIIESYVQLKSCPTIHNIDGSSCVSSWVPTSRALSWKPGPFLPVLGKLRPSTGVSNNLVRLSDWCGMWSFGHTPCTSGDLSNKEDGYASSPFSHSIVSRQPCRRGLLACGWASDRLAIQRALLISARPLLTCLISKRL